MKKILYCLISIAVMALGMSAQLGPAKTQITDVMYRADGTPTEGTLVIRWPDFVTADNKAVAAGWLSVTLGTDGSFTVALAPTVGATPAGVRYTVEVTPSDGTQSSQEYWVVPTTSPATLSAVRAMLVPADVAVQMATNATDVVQVTGDQAIAGNKTFTGSVTVGATVLNGSGIVAPAGANFVWEGDSITSGAGLAAGQDWASQAMLGNWFAGRGTKSNFAVAGSTTQEVLNRYAAVHALSPGMTGTPGYFFLMAGITDITGTSDSAATILGRLESLWSSAKGDGYTVVAATLTGMQGDTAAQEATRQALNLSIRGATGWDYLLDFDGILPDASDPNYFQDGLHPTALGAVMMGRTAANVMPSLIASSTAVPAYDQSVQGWTNIGKWLAVGLAGTTDTLRVFPQTAGSGAQVVATNSGNTAYEPLTLVGTKVQYSHDGGAGDLLTLYPGGPGAGANFSSTTSNLSAYSALGFTASGFGFSNSNTSDVLRFYPGAAGAGTQVASTTVSQGAYSPLPITASNWAIDASGDISTHGTVSAQMGAKPRNWDVSMFSGVDLCAKLAACNAVAQAGDTCDATGITGNQNCGSTVTIPEQVADQLGNADITATVVPVFILNTLSKLRGATWLDGNGTDAQWGTAIQTSGTTGGAVVELAGNMCFTSGGCGSTTQVAPTVKPEISNIFVRGLVENDGSYGFDLQGAQFARIINDRVSIFQTGIRVGYGTYPWNCDCYNYFEGVQVLDAAIGVDFQGSANKTTWIGGSVQPDDNGSLSGTTGFHLAGFNGSLVSPDVENFSGGIAFDFAGAGAYTVTNPYVENGTYLAQFESGSLYNQVIGGSVASVTAAANWASGADTVSNYVFGVYGGGYSGTWPISFGAANFYFTVGSSPSYYSMVPASTGNGIDFQFTGSAISTLSNSFSIYGHQGHAPLRFGAGRAYSSFRVAGITSISSLSNPSAPTVAATGGTGTNYSYAVVAYDGSTLTAGVTMPSSFTAVSGAATLGQFLTVAIKSAGAACTAGNVLTVTGGNSDATVTVSSVNGSGGVTGLTLTTGGSAYNSTLSSYSTTGGSCMTAPTITGTLTYNTITPAVVDGYSCVNVLKTNTSTLLPPAGTVAGCSNNNAYPALIDYGQSTLAFTAPTRNTTGDLNVASGHIYAGLGASSSVCTASDGSLTTSCPVAGTIVPCSVGLWNGGAAIGAATYSLPARCLNVYGTTYTITGLQCYSNNNGSSTGNAADSGGNALLTGAVTATNTWGQGVQSSHTTIAAGVWTNWTIVADGVSTAITCVMATSH